MNTDAPISLFPRLSGISFLFNCSIPIVLSFSCAGMTGTALTECAEFQGSLILCSQNFFNGKCRGVWLESHSNTNCPAKSSTGQR